MSQSRREARTAYKQQPDRWVVYAARTGGRTWVGVTPNLPAAENRLGFSLRMGKATPPAMQEAWDGTLQIELLEVMDPDLSDLGRKDMAEALKAQWCARLGATPMLR